VERTDGEDAALTKVSEAEGEPEEVMTGMSEARSHQRRGKKTPTLEKKKTPSKESRDSELEIERCVGMTIRRSVLGRRETSSPPVNRAEPKTLRGVPAAKVARASREHTRCGYTYFVWVADIG
jgi:hypothetical protein